MQDLRVTGAENGSLLVTSDDGRRFRIAIDDELQSTLRRANHKTGEHPKVAPREIQAQIRAGRSAEDVAAATGAPLEYIQKFEGPVLAEREFIVTSALAVPVHTAMETDPLGQGSTFGTVMHERLGDLRADGETWTSWKEPEGHWTVRLTFTIDEVEHEALWKFDPKKSSLAPANNGAVTLSQQGEAPSALIPRLRAVGAEDRTPDSSRFDSAAFSEDELARETAPYREAPNGPFPINPAAINREPATSGSGANHTADLLEALRRRRGERESASFDEPESMPRSAGTIRVVDVPLDHFVTSDAADTDAVDDAGNSRPEPLGSSSNQRSARKGRAAMPSWEDIVFGAKSDDD